MANVFSRSWHITKLSFSVIKEDKELLLFPILSGVFSLLFLIAMLFPTIITSFLSSGEFGSAIDYAIIFLVYLGLAFIATFFNVCVVYTTKTRFSSGNATFMQSIRFAFSKIHLIFLWSLVAATVGLLLRVLDQIGERMGKGGEMIISIITSLLGLAWGIITIFVVPSLVYYDLTPFKAIKKSAQTLKKTWGESLIRYYGLMAAELLFLIVGAAVFVGLAYLLSSLGLIAIISILGLGVVYVILVILVFSVANSVFNTALFEYADKGHVPQGFSKEVLEHSFAKGRKRSR